MNFQKAREASGKSVAVAAEEIGVTAAAIYQWENGQTFPDARRLAKIAEVYGTTVDALLREEPVTASD